MAHTISHQQRTPEVRAPHFHVFKKIAFDFNSLLQETDPLFSKQWNLLNFGQKNQYESPGTEGADIGIKKFWDLNLEEKKTILIAILDTGIDKNHPDLKSTLFINQNEIPNNNIDDDHNGYIDDVSGWDFINQDADPNDDSGHGTHVAGIITAKRDNGIGISGIASNVKLLPLKMLNAQTDGTLEATFAALQYAINMNVDLIQASWGQMKENSHLKELLAEAKKKGILFITTAANESINNDLYSNFPSHYDLENIVVVASSDNNDHLALDSNWGRNTVDLVAPGSSILSTYSNEAYQYLSGTSMAAPHVTGAIAALMGVDPSLSAQQAYQRIFDSVDLPKNLAHKVRSHGRINIWNAYQNLKSTKPTPQNWKKINYHLESSHSLSQGIDEQEIYYPNAQFIRVHFKKIQLNENERIMVGNQKTNWVNRITNSVSNHWSEYVIGDRITLKSITDYSSQKRGWGYLVDAIEVQE